MRRGDLTHFGGDEVGDAWGQLWVAMCTKLLGKLPGILSERIADLKI